MRDRKAVRLNILPHDSVIFAQIIRPARREMPVILYIVQGVWAMFIISTLEVF